MSSPQPRGPPPLTARFITSARAIAAQGFDLLNRAQGNIPGESRGPGFDPTDVRSPGFRPPGRNR